MTASAAGAGTGTGGAGSTFLGAALDRVAAFFAAFLAAFFTVTFLAGAALTGASTGGATGTDLALAAFFATVVFFAVTLFLGASGRSSCGAGGNAFGVESGVIVFSKNSGPDQERLARTSSEISKLAWMCWVSS